MNTARPGRSKWKPAHYDFLNRIANGEAKGAAWKATVGSGPGHCARWQRDNRTEAELYLAELREAARQATVLSLMDKREYLARVVRTPIGDVDEGSDLCQESTTEETEVSSKKRVKMPDKLRAIELDAKLAGELKDQAPTVTVDAMALLIEQIRAGFKPTE